MGEMFVIGIDHWGYEHVIDKDREIVTVLDSRGIYDQIDWDEFPSTSLEDWLQHVEMREDGPWRETYQGRLMQDISSALG